MDRVLEEYNNGSNVQAFPFLEHIKPHVQSGRGIVIPGHPSFFVLQETALRVKIPIVNDLLAVNGERQGGVFLGIQLQLLDSHVIPRVISPISLPEANHHVGLGGVGGSRSVETDFFLVGQDDAMGASVSHIKVILVIETQWLTVAGWMAFFGIVDERKGMGGAMAGGFLDGDITGDVVGSSVRRQQGGMAEGLFVQEPGEVLVEGGVCLDVRVFDVESRRRRVEDFLIFLFESQQII